MEFGVINGPDPGTQEEPVDGDREPEKDIARDIKLSLHPKCDNGIGIQNQKIELITSFYGGFWKDRSHRLSLSHTHGSRAKADRRVGISMHGSFDLDAPAVIKRRELAKSRCFRT